MKITALNRVKIGVFLGVRSVALIGGIMNQCNGKKPANHGVPDIETRR